MGAKMVEFANFLLPIQFEGIVKEHNHTRKNAALFDVSHMGQIIIRGENFSHAAKALEQIVPSNIASLNEGQMRYSVLLNKNGGIIDDLMISRPTLDQAPNGTIFLVVNGATKQKDFEFVKNSLQNNFDIFFEKEKSLIALQGPKAKNIIAKLLGDDFVKNFYFMNTRQAQFGDIICDISRSGYSGEDGFEISLEDKDAPKLAKILLNEQEVKPAGLGARDILRLEAGLCLYGHDIDENIDPISASLTFTIGKNRREIGGFNGAEIVLKKLKKGTEQKRIGIIFEGRMPVREGAKLFDNEQNEIGRVTSGGFSPSLQQPIAMGYIISKYANIGENIIAIVRDKQIKGEIVKLPFIKHNYYLKPLKNRGSK